jgi:uncharacterized membrane protein (DUF106 family)
MELTTLFVSIVSIILTGAGTSIGIYIKLNNELSIAMLRIGNLEKNMEHLQTKVEDDSKEILKKMDGLKDDIHELSLLIEKNKQ